MLEYPFVQDGLLPEGEDQGHGRRALGGSRAGFGGSSALAGAGAVGTLLSGGARHGAGRGGPPGAPRVLRRPGEAQRPGQYKEWALSGGLQLLLAVEDLDGRDPEVPLSRNGGDPGARGEGAGGRGEAPLSRRERPGAD